MLQCTCVNAARKRLAGIWNFRVPCAGQTRDAVEEDHHIVAVFDHSLGFFDDHFRHLNMPRGWFVKSAAHHLTIDAFQLAFHVRHFFRTFVNQQYDHVSIRMILLCRFR